MPDTVTRIRIHLASAADVQEERQALENVVAELQRSVGEKEGLLLELAHWGASPVPAIGSRPQEVINRQIPATDVFVGIVWKRFGTPTAAWDSGTEAEFRSALDAWHILARPYLLFYFCERPVAPSDPDIEQLVNVVRFRQSISEHGLYRTYTDVEEFRQSVREDLSRIIPQLAASVNLSRRPPRLFYSYAHEDAGLREELAKHLRVLERRHVIESWYDDMIVPGVEWSSEVAQQLATTDIVVLLVSADFLDSDYCYKVEMEQALKGHDAGRVRVVPIIVRAAIWEESPLARLKALPRDAKPVTLWADRDEAWTDVARGIKRVADEFTSMKR